MRKGGNLGIGLIALGVYLIVRNNLLQMYNNTPHSSEFLIGVAVGVGMFWLFIFQITFMWNFAAFIVGIFKEKKVERREKCQKKQH